MDYSGNSSHSNKSTICGCSSSYGSYMGSFAQILNDYFQPQPNINPFLKFIADLEENKPEPEYIYEPCKPL